MSDDDPSAVGQECKSYRKDNDDVLFAFYNDGEIETYFESSEGFVNEDVLD